MITSKLIAEAIMFQENCTKNRVSTILGTSRQSPLNWINGTKVMSDEIAVKAASLLGWDEKVVLAWLVAERYKGHAIGPELQCFAHDLQKRLAPEIGAEFQQELPLAS